MKSIRNISLAGGIALLLGTAGPAQAEPSGNRYGYPVLYKSDVSSAAAWDLINKGGKPKPVIIDVRRVEEYAAGHPKGAYSVPFPHITGSPTAPNQETATYIGYDITVDPEVGFLAATGNDGIHPIQEFVDYVSQLFANKNTPILLLCATGHRSVQAANALAKYGAFTNVRNIWEGYNGQPKYAYTGDKPTIPLVQLDLNNDDVLDGKDRDGWAYFQNLPRDNDIRLDKIDQRYLNLYPAAHL
jgi:rhodanese-related sulfurtransferase